MATQAKQTTDGSAANKTDKWYTAAEVLGVLDELKWAHSDAIEAKKDVPAAWWSSVIQFSWKKDARTPKEGSTTSWVNVLYAHPGSGLSFKPLKLLLVNEVQSGNILPLTAEGAAAIKAATGRDTPALRQFKAAIQIREYKKEVATTADGDRVLDSKGEPILPDPEFRSPYFGVIEHLEEIMDYEVTHRIKRGGELAELVTDAMSKLKNAEQATAAALEKYRTLPAGTTLPSVIAEYAERSLPASAIIPSKNVKGIPMAVFNKAFVDTNVIYHMPISSTTVVKMIQREVGQRSANTKDCGKPLANPITRINFAVQPGAKDSKDPAAITPIKTEVYTTLSPKKVGGKLAFDKILGEETLTTANIHSVIKSGDIIARATVRLDSLCISQMGISMVNKVEQLYVTPTTRKDQGADVDDLFSEEELLGFEQSAVAAATTPAASTATTASTASSAADETDDAYSHLEYSS
jgi:hypothetical protein